MLRTILPAAVFAVAGWVAPAFSQVSGPAELPPPGFAGQQYVDSRGCVFMRAGAGGNTVWVARVGRNRQPLCGFAPSLTTMAEAQRELRSPAPAPAPAAGGSAPMDTVATTTAPPRIAAPARTQRNPIPPERYAVPRVAPAPAAPQPAAAGAPAPHGATPGCPPAAPIGHLYDLVGGGAVLVCTHDGRRFTGLRVGDQELIARIPPAPGTAAPAPSRVVDLRHRKAGVPAGYKPAWSDDRLNPQRGKGTAEGDASMRQVWTDTVPQRQIAPATAHHRQSAGGARFVQVGSYAVPANASRAASRLQAMGYPVQIIHGKARGKSLQVVRAGPFGSEAQAVAALGVARQAGYRDAILRR